MHISELDTPALLIDLDVMERNLQRVSDYARTHNLRLRPHTKTHKIPGLGRRQLDSGAVGLTVAKVGEAEVMLGAEPPDMLVAYPVIGERKLRRLMEVARRTELTVSLDSREAASQLSAAAAAAGVQVNVLAEMDAGMGRVGIRPGAELIGLGRTVAALPGLALQGIAFYPGHIKANDESGLRALAELSALVCEAAADFRRAGLPTEVVSGGSTPTLFRSHQVAGVNEIRPGTYIFNDRNTVACGACEHSDCAATILVTVVSTSRKNGMIIDGGSKTFSSDLLITTGEKTFGDILEAPGITFFQMNEEHGYVDLGDAGVRFQVGDQVRVIPNHVCAAMNLHETVYGIRGESVKQIWRVEGRGKLQ
jgi:D-serine deaminase-like pyridoxal phosphate-dependent protein